jgi:hypothetical protein
MVNAGRRARFARVRFDRVRMVVLESGALPAIDAQRFRRGVETNDRSSRPSA